MKILKHNFGTVFRKHKWKCIYIQIGDINTPFVIDKVE